MLVGTAVPTIIAETKVSLAAVPTTLVRTAVTTIIVGTTAFHMGIIRKRRIQGRGQ